MPNRSSVSDFAYSYPFSVAWSVRLYVVCHTGAPCLNHSTDLHAIWQVRLWVQGHIVLDGVPDLQGKGGFWGPNPNQNMQLQIAAVT